MDTDTIKQVERETAAAAEDRRFTREIHLKNVQSGVVLRRFSGNKPGLSAPRTPPGRGGEEGVQSVHSGGSGRHFCRLIITLF